jgi:sulfoxide reductase heme-binding subunit YedZ
MPGGVARALKPAVFLAAAVPAVLLGVRVYRGDLGVDPAATLLHQSGRNTLLLLIATLSVTPIRRLTGWNRVQRVRRMLGLWTFFYAVAHVSMYLVFDQLCYSLATCDFPTIWEDVTTRRFIIAGMTAWTILLLMALTSTTGWIRRLGRNWQRLHRLVYVAAAAALVHFAWKEKSDYSEAYQWGAVVAVLLGIRLYSAVRKRVTAARSTG